MRNTAPNRENPSGPRRTAGPRAAALSPTELGGVVRELARALAGGRVQSVHDAGERAFALTFRASRRNLVVLVSAKPRVARLCCIEKRPEAPPAPSPFCALLRGRLKGARSVALRPSDDGRRVELELERRSLADSAATSAGRAAPPAPSVERTTLALELDARKPDLLVLDARRRVMASLAATLGDHVAHIGSAFPQAAGQTFDTSRVDDAVTATDAGAEPAEEAIELALNREVAARLATLEADVDVTTACRDVERRVKRAIKRRRRACDKVAAEMESFEAAEDDRRLGELLKASFHELRRGLAEIEVVDWYATGADGGQQKVTIPLDPALGPQENVERYFARHRKARRARPVLEARLETLRSEEAALRDIGARVRDCEDVAAIADVARELDRFDRGRGGRRRAKRTEKLGPRRFVSADGYEILVGRNSRQNDELSLRIARGNDIFLHVSGRPGAHAVIRTQKGKSVPTETLLDAGQLALYYSLPERSAGVFAVGAAAEVDYTPAKFLSKPRGARPGAVLLARHKTLRIELDKARMERLRRDVAEAPAVDRPRGP